ncbi:hypothetical protein PGT21_030998 [Puccinia graminis f. sp. tritici]|uniref:Uncharacterized protein n=1 Tax=Puccinia graminis f. sp. tritici TaxID=56615 RepID=A0A5B0S1X9_PUCGR|nr:hypothetical protein PGT21_030998 [Puccinia graminis f. sp. tritici]KAA1131023.1 hypothetical protein PGTUg99_026079 [Puccinia graminis f. sp. tritici]
MLRPRPRNPAAPSAHPTQAHFHLFPPTQAPFETESSTESSTAVPTPSDHLYGCY